MAANNHSQTRTGRLRRLHGGVQEDTVVALRGVEDVHRRRPAELLQSIIHSTATHRTQVGIDPSGADMKTFVHPKSCCYVLSPNGVLDDSVRATCHALVSLPAAGGDGAWHRCDPAASISVVLYDRCAKMTADRSAGGCTHAKASAQSVGRDGGQPAGENTVGVAVANKNLNTF